MLFEGRGVSSLGQWQIIVIAVLAHWDMIAACLLRCISALPCSLSLRLLV